ncbi:MAG: hypothetical protein N0C84_16970 [Candidatus Thiodiazotropha taylori]|uniref:Uncharacterized protein n=1 Tax=Candidatus Thiodiazotropha taylori TaxID=2792791 RepID=A0A9E4N5T8_9GAMM|nr:hypothetical protein [Candidatus Thiodiazotropha taylori]MCW4258159.1 hypothetical protein [Candidatus Thiodiazotropha taylori]
MMFFRFKTAKGGFPVTPNDDTDLVKHAVALYVTSAGSLRVTMHNGDLLDIPAVPVGPLSFAVRRVHSTGTTATVIALTHK